MLKRQIEVDMTTRVTEASGVLVAEGILAAGTIDALCVAGRGFIAQDLPTERMLDVLGMEDDDIALVLDDYNRGLRGAVAAEAERLTPGAGSRLLAEMAALDHAWDITMHLGNDNFKVRLDLPGRVIRTNGLSRPDESGHVDWEFSGKDLQDRDLPLHALSVVESPGVGGVR